jgi:hypothetical protein
LVSSYLGRGMRLKPNLLGMIGAIFALASLALPWWTVIAGLYGPLVPGSAYTNGSKQVSLFPFHVGVSADNDANILDTLFSIEHVSTSVNLNIWYGWAALVFMVIGSISAMAGSILSNGKRMLIGGGALMLLAIILFVAGLQSELSQTAVIASFPKMGLFSSGSFMWQGNYFEARYNSYLSLGFWIALLGVVLILVASRYRVWPRIGERPLEKTEISQTD